MEIQMKVAALVTISLIIVAMFLRPVVVASNDMNDTMNDIANETADEAANDTSIHFPLELANNSINLNVVQQQRMKNVISIPNRIINLEFADYFSDDNSNWGTYPNDDECERYIDDGKLKFDKISEESDILFYSALREYSPPENFIVEFNATIERNRYDGQIGIIFRKIDYDNFYSFLISRDGEYEFDKEENGHESVIIPWTNSSSIKVGKETNTIKVKCEGDTFTFYINGAEIDSCTDSSFANGDIVLVAGVGDNSLDNNKFSFDNFKIWSIKYCQE